MGCDGCEDLPCADQCGDNLACMACPVDTYQPVNNPISTTLCLPCPLDNGRKKGTVSTGNTNSNQCVGKLALL